MFTLNGIRNAFYCAIAFGIIACAAAPGPMEKLAGANGSIERPDYAPATQYPNGERAIPGRAAAGAQ
jgi:hypothetical protein